MDLYVFDYNEDLLHIINEKDIIGANQIEKTSGESLLNVTIPATLIESSDIIEGAFFGFYDLDNDFVLYEINEVFEEETDGGLTKVCECENHFYELRDNILEDERVDQATAISAVNSALTGSRWSVGTIETFGVYTQNFYYESSLSGLEKIRQRWLYTDVNGRKQQGTFKFRLILTGNAITSRLVDFKRQSSSWSGKRIVIGKDLTRIKRTVDNSELITSAYGRGKGLEIESDNKAYISDQDQFGDKSVDARVDFSSALWVNDFPTFTNGGFENDLTGWTVSQGTITAVTTRFYRDKKCAKITDTVIAGLLTSSTIYSVSAGQNIDASMWVNTPTTIPDGRQKGVAMYFYWYIGAIYQGTQAVETYRPNKANFWELMTLSATVPAGIDGVVFGISTSATVEVGDMYFDEYLPSDPTSKPLNQEWVEDPTAKALYGRAGGTINRMGFYYDDAETNPENLLTKTWEYIQQYNQPKITYEADIIDIDTSIRLGDLIYILDENFPVPVEVTARAIEINRDLLLPENTDITLGNFLDNTADINQRQLEIQRKITARSDVWDRSSAFESVTDGTRMRMVQQEGEYQSVIKYEDDSVPPKLIGYFSPEEFNYKKIRCDEFVGQNIITVARNPITYYVDSFAGDDTNDGLTLGTAFKSMNRLLSNGTIPKILLNNITCEIRDTSGGGAGSTPYNEDVLVEGIQGQGILFFNFDDGVILNGSLEFSGCTAWIYVQGAGSGQYGFVNSTDSTMPIRVNQCLFFYTRYMWYNANSLSSFGLFTNASRVSMIECVIENSTLGALTGDNSALISCVSCRGTNAGYAIRLTGASRAGVITSRPSGALGGGNAVPFCFNANGCIIAPSFQTSETPIGGLASPAGGSTPPSQTTQTISASLTNSWRLNYAKYRTDNDYMYQGSWGYGNHIGIAYWNTGGQRFSDIASSATTIKSAILYVKRLNAGGYSTARAIAIYGHNQLTPPTTFDPSLLVTNYGELATLKWGEELAIDMPSTFLTHVKSGTIAGIAIYQADEEPYVLLEGANEYNIRIEFKYE